ncbi:hypothetical protein EDD27_9414 [Nonomuraea polychroma]|uniref:Uncharacterized protein n=1 Tax=Nonomuraea polychroma TaxID=46176 RepID=A0A438MLQ9_9ACTN|nr:hypothetical protein [Nonomuraea polychroma]RVX46525.1 hypothetical protein EDD27_9414 [Nonomuraea polychroma]
MTFLPREYHHRWVLPNRDCVVRAMFNVEQLLKPAAKEIEIEIELADAGRIHAADLRSAFAHPHARGVKMSVFDAGYRICIHADLESSPLTIEVTGYGSVPQEVRDAISKEIRPYALPDTRKPWPKRLWRWLRADLLREIVAGVIVTAILGAIGWAVSQLT